MSFGLYAQSLNCEKFKSGKFQSTYNGHTAIIERRGSRQTEYFINLKDSLKMSFDVKWLNSCSYTLVPTKESFDKYPKLPKSAVITVEITNTTANSYTQKSTASFTPGTIISEMIIIK